VATVAPLGSTVETSMRSSRPRRPFRLVGQSGQRAAFASALVVALASIAGAEVIGGEADRAPAAASPPSAVAVEVDPGITCSRSATEMAALVEVKGQRVLSLRCTTRDRVVKVTLPDGSLDRSVVWYVRARGSWVNLRTPPGVSAMSFEGEGFYEISDATGEVTGRGASPDPGTRVRGGERRDLTKGR